MQDKLLVNPVLANVNYDNIAALQQKRTLAFVNHFILTTVQFLNNFAKQCELKLMHFENKLEKINATMVLLETRLASIPEVNNVTDISKVEESIDNESEDITIETNTTVEVEESVSEDPVNQEYMRFVKMVQVGVPLQAVKLKLSLEGLDPNELDKILKY